MALGIQNRSTVDKGKCWRREGFFIKRQHKGSFWSDRTIHLSKHRELYFFIKVDFIVCYIRIKFIDQSIHPFLSKKSLDIGTLELVWWLSCQGPRRLLFCRSAKMLLAPSITSRLLVEEGVNKE